MMRFIEFLTQKRETSTEIGKFECDRSQLSNMLITLMERLNMSNPTRVTSHAGKAVTIVRNGDRYTLTINSFKPPIKISWTGTIRIEDLLNTIDSVANSRKKVAYINTLSDAKGMNSFQLALV